MTNDLVIQEIVDSYEDLIIRTYSKIRFTILRQPFLEEINQWLPERGRVLDLGSGFGLFSLYFAAIAPERQIVGVELDKKRVECARKSRVKLGLTNVDYHSEDVLAWEASGRFDAIYMLDVIHHLPAAGVPAFLQKLVGLLEPGGTLLLKDVSDRPVYKMLFTLALDRAMVGFEPIRYWPPKELAGVLDRLGLDVKRHLMNDYLPYPHVLYICRKR